MMNDIYIQTSERLSAICHMADLKSLPLNTYHRGYLDTLLNNLQYYSEIYSKCFSVIDSDTPLKDIVCVDYGGGCGLLSIYAKLLGIGKVIYIDINPLSVESAQKVFKKTGLSADVILHGDVSTLQRWCSADGVTPDLLISTDVIEHIYDLNFFFKTLREINPTLRMIFTTASVASNPFKNYALHKAMKKDEIDYFTQRFNYIQNKFPAIDKSQAVIFAGQTRGLIYSDIDAVVMGLTTPPVIDKYNTCDPETGNFTERILTLDQYKDIVKPSAFTCYYGFYNAWQKSKVKRVAATLINSIIEKCPSIGKMASPFIIIQITLLPL